MMKKFAVFTDYVYGCNCGLNVLTMLLSGNQIFCYPVPTGIYSHPKGEPACSFMQTDQKISDLIQAWKGKLFFEGVVTGFFPTLRQYEILFAFLDAFSTERTKLFVDPVLGDDGELFGCLDNTHVERMRLLSFRADFLLPNLTELCLLTETDYGKVCALPTQDLILTIAHMSARFDGTVITTGVPLSEEEIACVICDGTEVEIIRSVRHPGRWPGTGDAFTALFASEIVADRPPVDSVLHAMGHISQAIRTTCSRSHEAASRKQGLDLDALLSAERQLPDLQGHTIQGIG